MADRQHIAFGFVGVKLDACDPRLARSQRMRHWRPSVALCLQPSFHVDRLVLFVIAGRTDHLALAERVASDIRDEDARIEVEVHELPIKDPCGLRDTFRVLASHFDELQRHRASSDEWFIHLTTGNNRAQACLMLLIARGHIQAQVVHTIDPRDPTLPPEHAPLDPALGGFRGPDVLDEGWYEREIEHDRETGSYLGTGKAVAMNKLLSQVEVAASRSRKPILLLGERGVGKSRLARRIWEQKSVAGKFVEVNCATLRDTLLLSTLFGHVRGAFTGAERDSKGLLSEADGGVLFLDEIGEMDLSAQAMLLRALDDKGHYRAIGATDDRASDFQLVAGTNVDLDTSVREKRFRADLLDRIQCWRFEIPPLRDRTDEIGPIILRELENKNAFSPAAWERYIAFAMKAAWPGNVRELLDSTHRLRATAHTDIIEDQHVRSEIVSLEARWGGVSAEQATPGDPVSVVLGDAASKLDVLDREGLRLVLSACREAGTLSEAGRSLFGPQKNDAHRLRQYLLRRGLGWKNDAPFHVERLSRAKSSRHRRA